MNKVERKRLLQQIIAVRQAGDEMSAQISNVCFMIAKDDNYSARLHKTLIDCRKAWDASISQLDTSQL